MQHKDGHGGSVIDFDRLADRLQSDGLDGLDMKKLRDETARERHEESIRIARREARLLNSREILEPEISDNDDVCVEGEDEFVDWHNAQIANRKKEKLEELRRNSRNRVKKEKLSYPSCLPDLTNQMIVPVPVGLLRYPLTCIGDATSAGNLKYAVKNETRTLYSRKTKSPDGQIIAAPDYKTSTILFYMLYGIKYSKWSTNDFTLKDNTLTLPALNRMRRDLYDDKGPSHLQLKTQLKRALDTLMHTSYYIRRFYGMVGDKTVKIDWIVEDYDLTQASHGRREIRPQILFSKNFIDILDITQEIQTTTYRRISLHEHTYCNTPYSRRLYEIVMMDLLAIYREREIEIAFSDFRDRFGLIGTMRNRPSQVLARIQDAMEKDVTPITGVTFDYSGNKLIFSLSDVEKVALHINLESHAVNRVRKIPDADDSYK